MAEVDEEKQKKRGGFLTSILIAVVALLLCTSVFFGWKLSNTQDEVLVKEKDRSDVTAKYNKLKVDYDNTLDLLESSRTGEAAKDKEIDEKKAQLMEVLAKLEAFKNEGIGSIDELRSLKAQLWKMRNEIRELQKRNEELMAKNKELEADVQQKNSKISGLESDVKLTNAELAQQKAKASLGAKILGRDFQAEGVRQRRGGEKNTRNPRSVERLRLTFTLNENPIAKPGLKKVYLCAIAPDNTVFTNGGSTFPFNGQSKLYTEAVDIDYTNTDKDVVIYASPFSNTFTKGVYKLEAYMDGYLLGTATVELK